MKRVKLFLVALMSVMFVSFFTGSVKAAWTNMASGPYNFSGDVNYTVDFELWQDVGDTDLYYYLYQVENLFGSPTYIESSEIESIAGIKSYGSDPDPGSPTTLPTDIASGTSLLKSTSGGSPDLEFNFSDPDQFDILYDSGTGYLQVNTISDIIWFSSYAAPVAGTIYSQGHGTGLVGGGIPTPAPVPEPATMLLMGAGLLGLAGYGRKKFNKK